MKTHYLALAAMVIVLSMMIARMIDDLSGNVWAGYFWLLGILGGLLSGILIGWML